MNSQAGAIVPLPGFRGIPETPDSEPVFADACSAQKIDKSSLRKQKSAICYQKNKKEETRLKKTAFMAEKKSTETGRPERGTSGNAYCPFLSFSPDLDP
ncbi:hypothetical protein ABL840_28540 [Variovorax sp. NFACC27]|uniref:hypothetical protein n=1 Tax=unclassified Variovorax TaxID=663243 RepID=UPI00115FF409